VAKAHPEIRRLIVYLLDGNVISELRRRRPHGAVVAWIQAAGADQLNLAAVTLGEIQTGIERTRDQDSAKAAEIEVWADHISQTWNILPMSGAIFREWAKLMHHRSDTVFEDAMIAATARVHELIVVTRNVKHFRDLGVTWVDPFVAR
jgi:predicted nucleic acid-binding protein